MKTKLISTILAVMLIISCIFTLTACGGFNKKDGNDDDQTQTGDQNNDNDDDDDDLDLLSLSVSFAEDSWEVINAVSLSGLARSYYSIGDEKEVLIAAEPHIFRIIGFNHDDLSDGSGKAGITLDMAHSMNEIHKYNSTNTKEGGWANCELRKTTFPYLFNLLQKDLQAVIKTVNKKTDKGGAETDIETTADKLFLLAPKEVVSTGGNAEEGTRYEFYSGGGSVKKQRNGSFQHWFLRSPTSSTTAQYLYAVSSSGSLLTNGSANQSNIFLSFAFCV